MVALALSRMLKVGTKDRNKVYDAEAGIEPGFVLLMENDDNVTLENGWYLLLEN